MIEMVKLSEEPPTGEDKKFPHHLAIPIAACSEATTPRPGGGAPQCCTIWRGPVRNPSWGLVSLEQGARTFLTGYGFLMAFFTFFLALAFVLQVIVLVSRNRAPANNKLPTTSPPASTKFNAGEVIAATQEINRAVINIEDALVHLFVMLTCGFVATSARKCKKALKTGAVSPMKTHFYILLIFVLADLLLSCYSMGEFSIWIVILLEVPYYLFAIIGLLFTYNYILSCVHKATRVRDMESMIDGRTSMIL